MMSSGANPIEPTQRHWTNLIRKLLFCIYIVKLKKQLKCFCLLCTAPGQLTFAPGLMTFAPGGFTLYIDSWL